MTRTFHTLALFVSAFMLVAILFAANAGQAKAIDGSGSVYLCPATAPYVHVNAFGRAYCSIYP